MVRERRTKQNPERALWVCAFRSTSIRLVQEAEQMQTDDDNQRNAGEPKDEIACHSFLLNA